MPAYWPDLSLRCAGANQSKLLDRCSLTPKRRPRLRAAFFQVPTISFFGPAAAAFHRGWYLESHMSKLSWWTPMLTKHLAPAFWYRSIRCSESQRSAVNFGTMSLKPAFEG